MEGSSRRDPPDRPPKKVKLKFRPKVPAQKPKKAATNEKPQQEELKPIDRELLRILRARQVTRKPPASTNDGRSPLSSPMMLSSATGGNLSFQSSGHEQFLPEKESVSPRAFPALMRASTGNPGTLYDDDDDNDDDDNDDDEFEERLPSSTECEASINPARELNLLEEDRAQRMLLFQLPKSLPLPRKSAVAERKGKATGKAGAQKGCNLQELPPGFLGKMLVYKSGKIKMKLGDLMFDVNSGVEYNMQQHAAAINTREKHCCVLGEIEKRHVVVTPDVKSLLKDGLD